MSGNCGGSIFIGSGNKDARCFRRPKPNREEPTRAGCEGREVVSKEMCPPELPSDRDDSEALVAGGASELALSTDSRESASTSGRRWLLVDARSFSSKRSPVLFLKPSGLRFLSIDFRSVVGFSNVVGSKERLRRANCCILLRLGAILASSSWSATVGAVVMMAGAIWLYVSTHTSDIEYAYVRAGVPGMRGTGGASSSLAACSFALAESWGSEAWRKRIRLKRLVLGVCSCTGGEGGESSSSSSWPVEGRAVSVDVGRKPSSEAAMRLVSRFSCDLSKRVSLSARRWKKPAGSRVLRRLRSRSLRPGRRERRGMAARAD